MATSYFLDKEKQPTTRKINEVLGKSKSLWKCLKKFVEDSYRVEGEYKYYGKNSGWVIRYKKSGRSLLTFNPLESRFEILVVLGKKETVEARKEKFGANITNIFKKAKQYHDGKWLFITVSSKKDIEDIKKLLIIKRKPKK
ncbi:DUF3788 domain-containing protein [Candidatus Dojkabacteria bacterium]|nr:DUF3788 domain-containing protein [Candidatus Dojkabacteria bacterium]